MPTSPPRLGLDVEDNIELENRLRRMEVLISQKVDQASLSEEGSEDLQRVDIVPQVTGLSVSGSTPGAITVAWNQVRISDLRRYELDVAEDLAFATNAETKNVAGTEFTYNTNSDTGGGGDTTIFIRVRARSSSGNVGAYSATLNTTTGQAQTDDIADDAVDSTKVDNTVTIQLALREYITPRGFHMSHSTSDTKMDLVVTRGVARGEADDGTVETTSTLIKKIDATWTAGNDGGGFPETALTLTDGVDYRVFAFGKTTGFGGDIGFDTSATAVNLIAEAVLVDSEYAGAFYRQIGWVTYTSAAIGLRRFFSPTREPEKVYWLDNIIQKTGTMKTAASRTDTLDAPADTTAIFLLRWRAADDSGQDNRYGWVRPLLVADTAASVTNFTHHIKEETETDDVYSWPHQEVELDASSQMHYRISAGTDNVMIFWTHGFIFYR